MIKWAGLLKVMLDAGLSIFSAYSNHNGKVALLFVGYTIADLAALWMLL